MLLCLIPRERTKINDFGGTYRSEILQIQEPSIINDDQTYEKLGSDISCNLGSLNLPNLMKSNDIGKSIEVAVRALTFITNTSSINTVPSIKNGNDKYRTIGLGAMSLATLFAENEIHYGSPESVDLTDNIFEIINYHTLKASNLIAEETGEAFVGFEKSKYYTGEYFDQYTQARWKSKYDKVRKLTDDLMPSVDDWIKLKESIKEKGLYHSYSKAIAPTGSISYSNEASASLHPITQLIEKRKEGN